MSYTRTNVLQKVTAVIAAGILAFSISALPSGLAHAANNGGGNTDLYLNLQKTQDKTTDVLRDTEGHVVINLNPLTIVVDNGDGTGSIYQDGFGDSNDPDGKITFSDPNEDTGIDVFIDDEGVPYTDDNGKIWPKDQVKVDFTGEPILHIGADGKYHITPKDDADESKVIDGKNQTVTVIGTDPYTVVIDDGDQIPSTGTVYVLDENGNPVPMEPETKVFTDPETGKPYSDAEGDIYATTDVEVDDQEPPHPILDENGNIIPKPGVTPIGNIGKTDESEAESNISFTVPISINFTSDSRGILTGPSPSTTYIENASMFGIHVSSMKFDTNVPFNVVQDAYADETTENAIDFKIGPTGGELEGYEYLTKKAVHNQDKWSMTSAVTGNSHTDTVYLNTSGHVNNINNKVTSGIKIGTVNWFVQTAMVEA